MGSLSVTNISFDTVTDARNKAAAEDRQKAFLDRAPKGLRPSKGPQAKVILASDTGTKAETPAAPLCPSHLDIDPLVNTPEFQEFNRRVGNLKDPTPPPMKASEKLSDVDTNTRDHHEKTAKVINEALKISIAHYTGKDGKLTGTKQEIFAYALGNMVITLRKTSIENSQNLIFRDADHYLAGRTQEWQRRQLDRETPKSPGYTTSYASGAAASYYDHLKRCAFQEQAEKNRPNSEIDLSTCPASAAGGREWAAKGNTDFRVEFDTLKEKAAPFLFGWAYKP